MSSGLMTNLISSWTSPCPVTPPPTSLFAKSTYSKKDMGVLIKNGPTPKLSESTEVNNTLLIQQH